MHKQNPKLIKKNYWWFTTLFDNCEFLLFFFISPNFERWSWFYQKCHPQFPMLWIFFFFWNSNKFKFGCYFRKTRKEKNQNNNSFFSLFVLAIMAIYKYMLLRSPSSIKYFNMWFHSRINFKASMLICINMS